MRVGGALKWTLFVLGGAATALTLGYLGLAQYLTAHPVKGTTGNWTDFLYADLQLFVLQPPLGPTGPIPGTLQIARFLAPATTVLAGLETIRLLLGEQLRRWAAAYASGHTVVTGDGVTAFELARRLRADHRKVVLVSTGETAADQARLARLINVSGDPADAATLRAAGVRRASVVYACADRSAKNAATALRIREIGRARGRPVVIYAQVRDVDIRVALRARRIGAVGDLGFQLDFFAIEEIAARVLLDQYPLAAQGSPVAEVVIHGFDRLGQAVLREVGLRSPASGPPLPVTVRGAAHAAVPTFLTRFPLVSRRCQVRADCAADDAELAAPGAAPRLVFICLPDTDEAMQTGLAAAHAQSGPADRVVICVEEPLPFSVIFTGNRALLDDIGGRLSIFEVHHQACVPEQIQADLTEQLARAVHRSYLREGSTRGDTRATSPAMVSWEDLPEELRNSNRAQAAHIGLKLAAIGCVITPETEAAPKFSFEDDEIDRLAVLEHDRWASEWRARGYRYGPARDDRHHPDLVDWADLSQTAKDKDRDTARELPALLHEAGFQILRPSPGQP